MVLVLILVFLLSSLVLEGEFIIMREPNDNLMEGLCELL